MAKALSLLPERDAWCVEFGAWDGKHLSTTYHLVESDGYRVVLIEGDGEKYRQLCAGYPFQDRGTDGSCDLRWHGGKLKVRQAFPKVLHQYPPTYSRWQRLLYRVYSRLNLYGVGGVAR